jgi:trimethylamine--corrinoid protein Co-methyltransferase
MLAAVEGVSIQGDRVRFSPDLCEKYLTLFRQEELAARSQEGYRMEGPWYPSNILDPDSGEIRPGSREDVRDLVRLCSALGITRRVCPLAPKDVPPEIEAVTAWKIALENSADIWGGPLTSTDEVDCVAEMAQVVGIKGAVWCTEIMISPLTINPEAMSLILHYLKKGTLVHGEPGPMISAGCTGPVFAPAFFAQALAEWLGAYIILKALSGGRLGNSHEFRTLFNGGLHFEPMHFDMRHGAVVFGTPEALLFRATARQVFRHLGGRPEIGGAFRTSAKQLDAQAIAQRAMSVVAEALDGVRVFVAAGSLANDQAVSPDLLVIDREIVRYAARVARGLHYIADSAQTLDAIRDVGPEGTYLAHPTTLEHYRQTYDFPDLFDHQTLSQWLGSGAVTLRQNICRLMEEKLARYDYRLDRDVQERLDAIYRRFAKARGASL